MYIYMYNIEVSFTEHDNLLIICLAIANESNFNKNYLKINTLSFVFWFKRSENLTTLI